MPLSLRLRHIHLTKLTPLAHAAEIQDRFVRQHLDHKAFKSKSNATSPPPAPQAQPQPILLTFTPPPTYATGRRDRGTLSTSQIASLRGIGPHAPPLPPGASPASFCESQRGGQTTFHGPGQLVAYLICDLKTHKLTPRSHVRLLETSVIDAVAKKYGLAAHTTENPGVWIGDVGDRVSRDDDRKLAAVGVHLRRNVSSFGVGLNGFTDLGWFDRIVACGLPGRKATSVIAEMDRVAGRKEGKSVDLMALGEDVARAVAGRLEGVDGEVSTRAVDVVNSGYGG